MDDYRKTVGQELKKKKTKKRRMSIFMFGTKWWRRVTEGVSVCIVLKMKG